MLRSPEKLVSGDGRDDPVAGIRVDDFYSIKFHKEPYVMWHIYAQYFHPDTLLERVRDVSFYRRPRTLFKGFRVPDWATSTHQHGWEIDSHSKAAWDQAMSEFNSETTPTPFFGERQEPNIIEWFRLEQFGKGNSSRLFYNEVPKPHWFRYNGHLDNPEEALYSFTLADQRHEPFLGIDTTTEEGRERFRKEWEALAEMTPELISKDNIVYPHELPTRVPDEAHYQRVWRYYREHNFRAAVDTAADRGLVSREDANNALRFLSDRHHLSAQNYVQTVQGFRPDLENDEGFLATQRVVDAIGLNQYPIEKTTAQTPEFQFWDGVDQVLNLTSEGLKEQLPLLVTDDANKRRVQDILNSGGSQEVFGEDQTQQLL